MVARLEGGSKRGGFASRVPAGVRGTRGASEAQATETAPRDTLDRREDVVNVLGQSRCVSAHAGTAPAMFASRVRSGSALGDLRAMSF